SRELRRRSRPRPNSLEGPTVKTLALSPLLLALASVACSASPAGSEHALATSSDEPAASASAALATGPLSAAEIQAAYHIPTGMAQSPIVEIDVAWADTSLETALTAYRAQNGLPPCTTANGCLVSWPTLASVRAPRPLSTLTAGSFIGRPRSSPLRWSLQRA